jgi:hypothetical protein
VASYRCGVLLVVAAVAAGAAAGRLLLRPLRYRHLGPTPLRWPAVLVAGVVLAVAADRVDGSTAVGLAIAGQALLVAGVLANLHLVGAGVVAVGLATNLASMAVDGGVPVRPSALLAAGIVEQGDTVAVRGPRHVERPDDLVPWLGDALPIEPLRSVVSFGDLIVAIGLADVAAHAARPRRQSSRTSPVHDWGTAPPAAPVSGCHHSASPDVSAPATVGAATERIPAHASR